MQEKKNKSQMLLRVAIVAIAICERCLRHGVRKEQTNEPRTPEVQNVTSSMESHRYVYVFFVRLYIMYLRADAQTQHKHRMALFCLQIPMWPKMFERNDRLTQNSQ